MLRLSVVTGLGGNAGGIGFNGGNPTVDPGLRRRGPSAICILSEPDPENCPGMRQFYGWESLFAWRSAPRGLVAAATAFSEDGLVVRMCSQLVLRLRPNSRVAAHGRSTKQGATMVIRGVKVLAAIVVYMAVSGEALAVVPINTCPAGCTSNCYLNSSVTCASGDRITLSSGADLDMHGNTITCSSGSCTGAAVEMIGGNSQVYNSLGGSSAFESVISGPFQIGVDCNGNTGSAVHGITIESSTAALIVECAEVYENRLTGGGLNNTGINVDDGIAASDSIHDNYMSDIGIGVLIGAASGISIDHNLFALTGGQQAIRFSNTTSSSNEFKHNIIMGNPSTDIFKVYGSAPPSSVFEVNLCDPSAAECVSCMGFSRCEDPISPFVLP